MAVAPRQAEPVGPALENVQLSLLNADPNQPRKHFDQESLNELAASIKSEGMVQPIVAVPDGQGKLTIFAGERRYRASKIAGLKEVPVIVRPDLVGKDPMALQIVENLQREDLTLAELAAGVTSLCKTRKQEEVAELLGKSKTWVSRRCGLLELNEKVTKLVLDGKIEDVEIARGVAEIVELDSEGYGEETLERLNETGHWAEPLSRDEVRGRLESAKRQKKQQEEAKKYEAKEAAKAAKAAERGEEYKPAPPNESDWQREARLSREKFAEILPAMNAFARDSRKAIIEALEARGVKPGEDFQLTIGKQADSNQNTKKAASGHYTIELYGSTNDAGRVLEALDPEEQVEVRVSLTVEELRKLNSFLTGPESQQPVAVRFLKMTGKALAEAAATIRKAPEPKSYTVIANDARPVAPAGGVSYTPERFLRERLVMAEGGELKAAVAYAAYAKACKAAKAEPFNLSNFGNELNQLGVKSKRKKTGVHYLGLALK